MKLFEMKHIKKSFDGLEVLKDISLDVEEGEVLSIIGPSGSGKSTILRCATGLETPDSGEIIKNGDVGLVFQQFNLFTNMTVLDNVKVGLHNQVKYTTATGILRLPSYFVKERAMNEKAMELLKIFDLDGEAGQPASSLPYGKQRKLEIARALATNPKLLLLDEPAAGMNPNETAELMETVRFVRDKFDIAVLLIEHDMSFVMGLCEHITVLDYGRIIAEGDPETVRSDPKVIAAYLGGEA